MPPSPADGRGGKLKAAPEGSAERPQALRAIPENLPADLKRLPQWVGWLYLGEADPETGEVDWNKPPLNVATGHRASTTNPATWTDWHTALTAYQGGRFDGLGFVLHRDSHDTTPGLVAIDLDKCRDPETGQIEEWARNVIGTLRSYTELSPSGRGLRILLRGKLPPHGRKRGRFEVYETARYVTVTGQHLQGMPLAIEDRQGGRMLQASAEGTAIEIAKGRYSEGGNFDVYLKGHAGDPLRVGRVGREGETADRLALSVALAVQPDVIRGLAADASMKGRGFLARFLYAVPQSIVGKRKTNPPPVPPAVADTYAQNMRRMWELEGGKDNEGNPIPTELRFSADADRRMERFEAWLEPQLGRAESWSTWRGGRTSWRGPWPGSPAPCTWPVGRVGRTAAPRSPWRPSRGPSRLARSTCSLTPGRPSP
ncbi:MAG: DUF3987 domain-containing protein [Gemmataceae bacterium]|nr:DUF3987 domain-containing protein [Gemmataceae bacterium]